SSEIKVTDVSGRQHLHTFSGDIDVAGAAGSIDAETFSGDIEVKLAAGAGGHGSFNSFIGTLNNGPPLTGAHASRGGESGDIGTGGANDYRFKTFSGDVRIR